MHQPTFGLVTVFGYRCGRVCCCCCFWHSKQVQIDVGGICESCWEHQSRFARLGQRQGSWNRRLRYPTRRIRHCRRNPDGAAGVSRQRAELRVGYGSVSMCIIKNEDEV